LYTSMGYIFYLIVFLIGLSLGSFFSVIVFRFNTDKSVAKGRSKCVNCQSTLKWYDLIPVFSYFALKSRCRNCKANISFLYPTIELTTAIVLTLFFAHSKLSPLTVAYATIVLLLLLIVFLDIRYFIIPDKIMVLLAILAIGIKLLTEDGSLVYSLFSALGLASFFVILFLVSKGRWIGFGDIKLVLFIGFLLEYPAGYLAILTAVWTAALFSLVLLFLKRADAKTEIPFGSFLSAATIIFLIFSNELQSFSKLFF